MILKIKNQRPKRAAVLAWLRMGSLCRGTQNKLKYTEHTFIARQDGMIFGRIWLTRRCTVIYAWQCCTLFAFLPIIFSMKSDDGDNDIVNYNSLSKRSHHYKCMLQKVIEVKKKIQQLTLRLQENCRSFRFWYSSQNIVKWSSRMTFSSINSGIKLCLLSTASLLKLENLHGSLSV